MIPFVSTFVADWSFHKASIINDIDGTYPNDGSAWPTANKAFYQEIYIPEPYTFTKLAWINAGAVSGNVDVAVYNSKTLARIRSTGSIAQSGTNAIQEVSVTSCTLPAGRYLLALAVDNAVGRIVRGTHSSANAVRTDLGRCFEQTSAFPLPTTAAPVTCTAGFSTPIILLIPATW